MPSTDSSTVQRAIRSLASLYGINVASEPVCCNHHAPIEFLTSWIVDRPEISLLLGPRGGGKSFLSAFETHISSIRHRKHGTRILGGSLAQSEQIYNAISEFDDAQPGSLAQFTKTEARYKSGSDVSILAASVRSVRGPHVPCLKLDEVDEIEPDIRESAMGMCMDRNGVTGMTVMTSTWHKVGGPMAELLDAGESGAFPVWRFCTFEVLERCPEERSGPNLEGCQVCPLKKWCHDEGIAEAGSPRAKRSNGHYSIGSLIQKARGVSLRVFESDYLCRGPKAAGLWFPSFNRATHVGVDAEYDPHLPVYLAVDCGTSRYTGATFFQARPQRDGTFSVTVFADYLGVDLISEVNARALRGMADSVCNGRLDRVRLDPASKARTSVGPVVYGEYERIFGSRAIAPWPLMSVRESLDMLDTLIRPAAGPPMIRIHPRCETTIRAIECFRRAKRSGKYIDEPEREDHPHEDMVDALKGGIGDLYPEGRKPAPKLTRRHAGGVF
jgi:hypothetical protein